MHMHHTRAYVTLCSSQQDDDEHHARREEVEEQPGPFARSFLPTQDQDKSDHFEANAMPCMLDITSHLDMGLAIELELRVI